MRCGRTSRNRVDMCHTLAILACIIYGAGVLRTGAAAWIAGVARVGLTGGSHIDSSVISMYSSVVSAASTTALDC